MAEQRPEAFTVRERVWHCYANRGAMCDGPVAVTHNTLRWMGWHWQAPGLFARAGRPHLRLLDGPESWWIHETRQGLRLAESKKAGATISALSSTKLPQEQRNDLRELLCCCVWTQKKAV